MDLRWEKGTLDEAVIKSNIGGPCRIRSLWPLEIIGGSWESEKAGPYYIYEMGTSAGGFIRIRKKS
jgi:hypothetical protein